MAYYSESGYCADEARRPYGEAAGFHHGEGGERYAVRKEYEEVDEVARAGRGHGHGHLGRSGSHGGGGGYHGEHREPHHVHGGHVHSESKRYDSSTGEY